jgi:hypothetical protein
VYIYLNAPRVFWQIPGTDVRLTRSKPILEITDTELESMTEDQRSVINLGLSSQVLTKVNKSFIPSASINGAESILKLPVQEIQRRHVSQMVLNRNLEGVKGLLDAEKNSSKSRAEVLDVLENAKTRILSDYPEESYYSDIEEAVENIEGVIVEESLPAATAEKKLPARRKRRTVKSQTAKTEALEARATNTGVTEK